MQVQVVGPVIGSLTSTGQGNFFCQAIDGGVVQFRHTADERFRVSVDLKAALEAHERLTQGLRDGDVHPLSGHFNVEPIATTIARSEAGLIMPYAMTCDEVALMSPHLGIDGCLGAGADPEGHFTGTLCKVRGRSLVPGGPRVPCVRVCLDHSTNGWFHMEANLSGVPM